MNISTAKEPNKITIVVGVPCSGKSWVCNQLAEKYDYIPHDEYMHSHNAYIGAVVAAANSGDRPVLAEIPFSMSDMERVLTKHRLPHEFVYIVEPEETLKDRYKTRENKDIPQGHLTRQKTYEARADFSDAVKGTSTEILRYLSEN